MFLTVVMFLLPSLWQLAGPVSMFQSLSTFAKLIISTNSLIYFAVFMVVSAASWFLE
jgi:hypothetical protein